MKRRDIFKQETDREMARHSERARQNEEVGARRRKMQRPRALQEIRKYQRSTQLLLRKMPFYRLVREITMRISGGEQYRWQALALEALQREFIWLFTGFIVANFSVIQTRPRRTWRKCSRQPTCAPSTANASPWCQRTWTWSDASPEWIFGRAQQNSAIRFKRSRIPYKLPFKLTHLSVDNSFMTVNYNNTVRFLKSMFSSCMNLELVWLRLR